RVFDFAQTALERDAGDAASALRDARVREAIPHADSVIDTLSMLVRALEDAERDQNPFEDDEGGGGSGGGAAGQGQQPAIMPIHELRLLREMQSILLRRTRAAEAAGNDDAARRVAAEQTELHRLASELLERVQSQSGGGAIPAPEEPEQPGLPDEPSSPEGVGNPGDAADEQNVDPQAGTEASRHAA